MLPSSGAISLSDIRTELSQSGTISLNDTAVRTLSGKTTPGSTEIMPTDFYGKSNAPPPSPTYSFRLGSSTSINEFNDVNPGVGLYYIDTTLVATGTTLYWTINHITTNDFDFGSTNGSFTIYGGIGAFGVFITGDGLTEGPETFTISIRTGSITGEVVATSSTVTINDTSVSAAPHVPDAPTIGVATSTGPTTATVAFTAPASNGGATITSYTAISTPGNITGTLSQSGSGIITVSGLSPSTSYTFKVKATNSVGDSAYSSSTSSITTDSAATVPGAPTIGVAIATGQTTATVSFSAPASNGGATITSYTAISTPGNITGTVSQSGSGSINITGLTAGTSYTFKVKATNSVGDSAYSSDSSSVVTFSAATVPGAPTIGAAIPTGQTTATVAFTPPSSDGGAAITGYSVISTPGSITATGSSSPITVTGLTASTSYTFKVRATNSVGNGSYSGDSASITTNAVPTVPGAPTITGATATGQTTADVSFSAPASNGGSPITSYTILSSPGSITATLSQAGGGTFNVTGLTAGTTYTFTVKATNAVGDSSYSSASSSITTSSAGPAIGFDSVDSFTYLNDQGNLSPTSIKWYIGSDGSIDGSGDFSGNPSAAGTIQLTGPTKYVAALTPGIGTNYEVKISGGPIGSQVSFDINGVNHTSGTSAYYTVGTGIYITFTVTQDDITRSATGTIYIRNKTTLAEISTSFVMTITTAA